MQISIRTRFENDEVLIIGVMINMSLRCRYNTHVLHNADDVTLALIEIDWFVSRNIDCGAPICLYMHSSACRLWIMTNIGERDNISATGATVAD